MCHIKCAQKATIVNKTLETIADNITKLLNIDKTNFVSPSIIQGEVINESSTVRPRYGRNFLPYSHVRRGTWVGAGGGPEGEE